MERRNEEEDLKRLNPPHVILLRLVAYPLQLLGKLGDYLWDLG